MVKLARFTEGLHLKNISNDSIMNQTVAAPTLKAILQNYVVGDGNHHDEWLDEEDFITEQMFGYTAYWLRAYYDDDNFDHKTRNYFISEFCRMPIAEHKKIIDRLNGSVNHVDLTLSDSLSCRFWSRVKTLFMEYDGDERTAIYFLKKFRDVYYFVIDGDNHADFPFLTLSFELETHHYRLKSIAAPCPSDTTVIVIDD